MNTIVVNHMATSAGAYDNLPYFSRFAAGASVHYFGLATLVRTNFSESQIRLGVVDPRLIH